MGELIVHIDGGARGNPGPAAAGVVIAQPGGHRLLEAGYFLGEMTNNMAEYQGLLRALEALSAWPDADVTIHSDSELLVRQITGQYRVRNAGLLPLYEQAQQRLLRLDQWRIRRVPREHNARADELANIAMDQRADVIVIDRRPGAEPPRSNGTGASARPTRVESDAQPQREAGRPVLARCTVSPAEGVCEMNCRAGQPFLFDSGAPSDLCLDGLASMLNTVMALRDTPADAAQATPPLRVRCFKRDCGAVFEVRAESNT